MAIKNSFFLYFTIWLIGMTACNMDQLSPKKPHEIDSVTPFDNPPQWAADVIWYEIGVERFRNGDPSNDPIAADIVGAYPGFVPEGWAVTPWTHDWYAPDVYDKGFENKKDFYGNALTKMADKVQIRRYGGDLQGVLDKIDYLDSLGVTAIYFRPLNDAPSLHKYDARNWRHIDRNFGPNPTKDKATMAAETPENPATWQWTEADKMLLNVIDKLHERGIRVILDYSWNHTGQTFWAWKDVVKNQEKSAYQDWYWIDAFDNPETPENEFKYHGWVGVATLPELRETKKQEDAYKVEAFEGNLYSDAAKQHIFNVSKRWLDPDGDGNPADGVDGFRLDVAGEMPLGFWREYRQFVRSINPEAYLLGEIWWEKWPDKLLDPEPFLKGDVFDAVMNYRWYRATRHFFNQSPNPIAASELIDSLNRFSGNLRTPNNYAMMNYTGGFDTPRLLTSLFNKTKYKYQCKAHENPNYKIHKPDATTYQTLKLLLAQQYTYVGAPHIYAGDEMGMWGADDPSCRKPLIWEDYDFDDEKVHPTGEKRPTDKVEFDRDVFSYFQKLIKIRKGNPVFVNGDIEFIPIDEEVLAYRRFDGSKNAFAVFNNGNDAKIISIPTIATGDFKDALNQSVIGRNAEGLTVELPGRTAAILVEESGF